MSIEYYKGLLEGKYKIVIPEHLVGQSEILFRVMEAMNGDPNGAALRIVERDNNTDMCEFLFTDPRVNSCSRDLTHVIKQDNVLMLKWCLSNFENVSFHTPIHNIIREASVDILKMLLSDKRVQPMTHQSAALTAAIKRGSVEIVRVLLGFIDPGKQGDVHLRYACSLEHAEIVDELMKYSSIKTVGIGRLIHAAMWGMKDYVGELLKNEEMATQSAKDWALREAARTGMQETINVLLRAGASVSFLNYDCIRLSSKRWNCIGPLMDLMKYIGTEELYSLGFLKFMSQLPLGESSTTRVEECYKKIMAASANELPENKNATGHTGQAVLTSDPVVPVVDNTSIPAVRVVFFEEQP